MSIKKQLSAYYDKQGLTGKHRRKAMQYDMKAVKANIPPRVVAPTSLFHAFSWHNSPQGAAYWYSRC